MCYLPSVIYYCTSGNVQVEEIFGYFVFHQNAQQ